MAKQSNQAAALRTSVHTALNHPASSTSTCQLIGYEPIQKSFLADLGEGAAFNRLVRFGRGVCSSEMASTLTPTMQLTEAYLDLCM